MANKDKDKVRDDTGKEEVSIQDLYRGINLDEKFHEAKRDSSANLQEIEASDKAYEDVTKQLRSLVKKANTYRVKAETGFDKEKAKGIWKLLGKFFPKTVAKRYKTHFTDLLFKSIKEIYALGETIDNLIIDVAKKHGELRNFSDTYLMNMQQTAITNMKKYMSEVDNFGNQLETLEGKLTEFTTDAEFKSQEYLSLKKQRGILEDNLDMAEDGLISATIRFDVAEDHYYQSVELMKKFDNTKDVLKPFNEKVMLKMKLSEKLLPYRRVLDKLVDAGSDIFKLDAEFDQIIVAHELAQSQKIETLSKVISGELMNKTYEPIIKAQAESSERVRQIIMGVHAQYVESVRTGDREKNYIKTMDEIKRGESPAQQTEK